MAMKFLSSTVLFSSLAIHASANAIENDADLLKRNLFPTVQGWALAMSTCPEGTTGCGAATCCPTGSSCDTSLSGSNVCCPTEDSCAAAVQKLSRCADSDWVLFTTNHDPICCLPGQVAVDPTDSEDYGQCYDADTPLSSGAITATLVGGPGLVTAPYTTPPWDLGESSPSTTTAGVSSAVVTSKPTSTGTTKSGGGIFSVSVSVGTKASGSASATGAAVGGYEVAGAGLMAVAAEVVGLLVL